MMEVRAGAFASKFTPITTEIWTDCMAMLKATADSWKTTTRYADHALPFETIRRMKPNLQWTRSHPEKHKGKTTAEWSKEDWGNYLADKLAGGKPEEVTVLVQRRAIHITISARGYTQPTGSSSMVHRSPVSRPSAYNRDPKGLLAEASCE